MVSQKSGKADYVVLGLVQSPDLVVAGAAGLLGEDLHLELEPQLGMGEAHLLPTPSQEEGEGEQDILESSNYLHTCIALFSDIGVRYLNTWRSTSSESFATVVITSEVSQVKVLSLRLLSAKESLLEKDLILTFE